MRSTTLLIAASLVLLSLPVASATALLPDAGTSADSCAPDPCGQINLVCRKAFGADCVRIAEASDVQCMGPVCEAINAVCWIALKAWCVG